MTNLAYFLGIAVIILLFASVGMTANLNMMITQNMREYIIHILCGGRYLDIACRLGKTIVIITHDDKVASYCNRVVEIADGKIV